MVERVITVCPLGGVKNQQLVDQVQSIRVLDISFETILHFSLLAFRQLHFLVQLIFLIYSRPHLRERQQGSR